MKELTLTAEERERMNLPINPRDTVKVIRERETDGLLGAILPVISVEPGFVDTIALDRVVRFRREDVILQKTLEELRMRK